MRLIWRFFSTAGLILATACTPTAKLPDLQAIYNRTAGAESTADRRPLITIPGTLGSRLVDTESGRVIWGGGSRGISADPENPEEYRLIALPVPTGNEPFASLRDTVAPDGILRIASVEFLGVPLDIDVYGGVGRTLAAGGFAIGDVLRSADGKVRFRLAAGRDRDEDLFETPVAASPEPAPAAEQFNSFNFDYDWRRDLIGSAHEFGRFMEQRRQDVALARNIDPKSVKFDLLAHSMGSMVARYFLMYGFAEPGDADSLPPITWDGAEYFSRVVFVAPPNSGSVIAMDNLINGKSLGPLQPFYPAAMLSTHVSPYQLMPRPRHQRVLLGAEPLLDLYDAKTWERFGWGLSNPDAADQLALMMPDEPDPQSRRARALAYKQRLLNRARTFHRMMDRWAPAPDWLDMFLVVGGGFETPASALVDPATGSFTINQVEEGDGVVLRASALLDERQDGNFTSGLRSPLRFKTTLFLPDEHVELTKNPVFGDNLLFWLVEAPRGASQLAKPGSSDIYTRSGGERTQQSASVEKLLPDEDR